MRSMYETYISIKKDYYLVRASEALAEAGKALGTDDFNVWIKQYSKYMDKAINLYS